MKTIQEIIRQEYTALRKDLTYPASSALHYAKQWTEIKAIEANAEIDIEIIAEFDDMPLRGNCIASGDDEFDAKVEKELSDRLERGDVWAWAAVEVRVTKGGLTESDYLGGCSYRNESDFKRGGYYYDMLTSCLERINSELNERESAACRDIVTA